MIKYPVSHGVAKKIKLLYFSDSGDYFDSMDSVEIVVGTYEELLLGYRLKHFNGVSISQIYIMPRFIWINLFGDIQPESETIKQNVHHKNNRAWQINEINDGLINLCKLGLGLMWINDGLMRINDKK